MCVRVCVCAYVCVCVRARACVCVCLYLYVSLNAWMSMGMHICTSAHGLPVVRTEKHSSLLIVCLCASPEIFLWCFFKLQPSQEMTALKEQLKTLTLSLTTLSQEKNRVECQFVADNKQLRVPYLLYCSIHMCLSSLSFCLSALT